jgi:hypothetical protein
MALLVNLDTKREISKHVSLEPSQKQNSVIQQTLDGMYHIQKIGSPAVSYDVTVYVDRDGKTLLMGGQYRRNPQVTVSIGIYFGRFIELKFGDRLPGDWFKADLTLAGEVTG